MKKSPIIWIAIGLVVLLFLGGIRGSYNKMVSMEETVSAQWSQVENVYQRRADLIPNLVNTVKGYASHERETLESVINARAKATQVKVDASQLNESSVQEFQEAQSGLSSALSRLMVVMERYPDLKADTGFRQLSNRISELEDQIADRRELYNASVTIYNTRLDQFPDVLIARTFNFADRTLWEINPAHRQDVEVSFQHS